MQVSPVLGAHFLPLRLPPPFQSSCCTTVNVLPTTLAYSSRGVAERTLHLHGAVFRPPPTLTVAPEIPETESLAKVGKQP